MERGLVGSLTLLVFFGLGLAGWRAYQAVQHYQAWAQAFQPAKYDPLLVLGYRQPTQELVWGKPTWRGITAEQSLDFAHVEAIVLQVDAQQWWVMPEQEPRGRHLALVLLPQHIELPFTDLQLAVRWWRFLAAEVGQELFSNTNQSI